MTFPVNYLFDLDKQLLLLAMVACMVIKSHGKQEEWDKDGDDNDDNDEPTPWP